MFKGLSKGTASCQTTNPLFFPMDNFTVETKTVKTSLGEKKVTYRFYMHIPYVDKPVDKDYQSMLQPDNRPGTFRYGL